MTDLRRYRQDQPDAGSTEAGQALLPVRDIVVKGIAITDMLNDMELPAEGWEQAALTLTRREAAFYPDYMKQAASKPIFPDDCRIQKCQDCFHTGLSERTVNYFCRLIYKNLDIGTRAEALTRATERRDV